MPRKRHTTEQIIRTEREAEQRFRRLDEPDRTMAELRDTNQRQAERIEPFGNRVKRDARKPSRPPSDSRGDRCSQRQGVSGIVPALGGRP